MDKETFRGGWRRDQPDVRDYTFKARPEQIAAIPISADLRENDIPILNQGPTSSCTSHAGVGIFEWHQKAKHGTFTPASRLFLYKESRDLEGISGDEGSTLRSTAKVMANEGLPPEAIWAFDTRILNKEPTDYVKGEALRRQVTNYYSAEGMTNLKAAIGVAGLPVMIGFTCYDSIFDVGSSGNIPLPKSGEAPAGGHAVYFVGYDDTHMNTNGSRGAFIIHNSWGTSWGSKCPTVQLPYGTPTPGYGWLPYWYVANNMVDDCWVIVEEEEDLNPPIPIPPEPKKKSLWEIIVDWFYMLLG